MGPAFFLDAPIILALPIDKLLSLSISAPILPGLSDSHIQIGLQRRHGDAAGLSDGGGKAE